MGEFFSWLFRSPGIIAHMARTCLALALIALALWALRDAIAHAFWRLLILAAPVLIIYFLVSAFRRR